MSERGAWANVLPKSNRKSPVCFSPWLCRQRNLVKQLFNKLKYYRRIATRCDKAGSAFHTVAKLACTPASGCALMSLRPKETKKLC